MVNTGLVEMLVRKDDAIIEDFLHSYYLVSIFFYNNPYLINSKKYFFSQLNISAVTYNQYLVLV